ncbi:MAG: hypothetical protein M3237_15865 [Actinomycetota bacterium]|nr:hypothetical protein [Actinomycetota bacterium]
MTGQSETVLDDGRRVISAGRSIEDGARGMLLLDPGRVRMDVTPQEDMFQLSIRNLAPDTTLRRRSLDRPGTALGSDGLDRIELPLIGAAALDLVWNDEVHYAVRLGSVRNAAGGTTTFTVQATVAG